MQFKKREEELDDWVQVLYSSLSVELLYINKSKFNLNSREKFEPGSGFEPPASRSTVWRSTT